jgi:hypothetical protein
MNKFWRRDARFIGLNLMISNISRQHGKFEWIIVMIWINMGAILIFLMISSMIYVFWMIASRSHSPTRWTCKAVLHYCWVYIVWKFWTNPQDQLRNCEVTNKGWTKESKNYKWLVCWLFAWFLWFRLLQQQRPKLGFSLWSGFRLEHAVHYRFAMIQDESRHYERLKHISRKNR